VARVAELAATVEDRGSDSVPVAELAPTMAELRSVPAAELAAMVEELA
jgi:hypothetical protein